MRPDLTCRDGVDGLMDYLEGVLGPADRQAVDAHVAGCPRCVAFIRSYRETPRILRAATAVPLPDAVAASLRQFLADHR